jgi:hypothetical protein
LAAGEPAAVEGPSDIWAAAIIDAANKTNVKSLAIRVNVLPSPECDF